MSALPNSAICSATFAIAPKGIAGGKEIGVSTGNPRLCVDTGGARASGGMLFESSMGVTRPGAAWAKTVCAGGRCILHTGDRSSPASGRSRCQLREQNSLGQLCARLNLTDKRDSHEVWAESREVVLAKRKARRLAERLAKPAYVNSDACCRGGRAGLAYESALLGNRTELVLCSDITLAEHLALLMAMRDAESRLSGRVVFRVDSSAVIGSLREGYPVLAEVKRQITNLLSGHREWSLELVERERNWPAHNLANRPLRDDD